MTSRPAGNRVFKVISEKKDKNNLFAASAIVDKRSDGFLQLKVKLSCYLLTSCNIKQSPPLFIYHKHSKVQHILTRISYSYDNNSIFYPNY